MRNPERVRKFIKKYNNISGIYAGYLISICINKRWVDTNYHPPHRYRIYNN